MSESQKATKTPQIFESTCYARFIPLDALLKTDIQNRILKILTIEKLTKFWPFWKQNIFRQKPQIFGTFPKKSTFSTANVAEKVIRMAKKGKAVRKTAEKRSSCTQG